MKVFLIRAWEHSHGERPEAIPIVAENKDEALNIALQECLHPLRHGHWELRVKEIDTEVRGPVDTEF